jgi:hypothetical protein
MVRDRSKGQKAKKRPIRPQRPKKGQPAKVAANKSTSEATRHLDQVVREFDGAAEGLQIGLDRLRGALPELIEFENRRDRMRRIKVLAADGILDSLQRLAIALDEESGKTGGLPVSLVPLHRSARMVIDHLCRVFEVQAVHQIGESLTVTHEQVKDFDWSADSSGEFNFPVQVEILRCGWKVGETVLVPARAVRRDR